MINKKLSLLVSLILGVCLSLFVSCGDDDDKYDVKIDEVWKSFNDSLFYVHEDSLVSRNGEYIKLPCYTGNGDVYYKRSTDIPPADLEELRDGMSLRVAADGKPQFTDSVDVRYLAWYYKKDDSTGKLKRIIFDGTEREGSGKASQGFQIKNLTSGFASMVQNMDIKDLNQVQVAIPYNLGYGEAGIVEQGVVVVPGYTTMYFNILLEKIIPLNPDEHPNVDLGGSGK